MGRAERNLLTYPELFPDHDPDDVRRALAEALAAEVRPGGRRAVFVREVNGVPAQDTPLARALLEAGFTFGPHGYMRRL